MLGTLGFYSLGGAIVLGGGAVFAQDFRRNLSEADLSKIGNGRPTIVQIHDPGCPMCRSLQRETRAALRACETEQTQYLVADIGSQDGSAFSIRMGLPHVTLVFFDGAGQQVHTIQGVTPADQIKADMTRMFG